MRPRLVSRALLRVFVAAFAGLSSFFLLLSVVPLYATAAGAGERGAGATTAALFLATVSAELVVPRLVHHLGYRLVFSAGLVLLGLPALALTRATQLPAIVVLNAVRGLGFGIVVVLGAALVAALVPASRRGEGFGVFGVVIGMPGVVALPVGVFVVERAEFAPVFAAAALVAIAGLVATAGLPGRRPARASPLPPEPSAPSAPVGILVAARSPALRRLAIVFGSAAMGTGVLVTFLPLAVAGGSADLAPLGLLVVPAAAMSARWLAGRYADRSSPEPLLIPALVAAATGAAALIMVTSPVALLIGAAVFGAGFGTCQAVTLVLMFNRAPSSRYGAVSALWNVAFDGGMGLGAAWFGLLAARSGFPAAFAVLAAVMLLALYPAVRDRRSKGRGGHG